MTSEGIGSAFWVRQAFLVISSTNTFLYELDHVNFEICAENNKHYVSIYLLVCASNFT